MGRNNRFKIVEKYKFLNMANTVFYYTETSFVPIEVKVGHNKKVSGFKRYIEKNKQKVAVIFNK